MAGLRFLLGADLRGNTLLRVGGQPVAMQHVVLHDLLQDRAPAAADLLAEPTFDTRDDSPPTRVSWYGVASADPVALEALRPDARLAAETTLRRALDAVAPLLDDEAIGPLVKAALIVGQRADILWTGEGVVLVNWGMVPDEVGEQPEALAQLFDATLAPFMPNRRNPWRQPATPSPRVAPPIPPAAPVPPVPPTGGPPIPPPAVPPPVQEPAGRFGHFIGATAAMLAAVVLVLLVSGVALAAGYYWGWSHLVASIRRTAPPAPDPAIQADLKRIQEGVNEGLRRRVATLEQTLTTDLCAPGVVTPPVRPGGGGSARNNQTPMPLLPPPADAQPIQPPAGQDAQAPPGQPGQPPRRQTLADLLDDAVVLVVGSSQPREGGGRGGVSIGTGFAIAPDRIVTNLHVVEGVAPGKLFVVSRRMSAPVAAEVIAQTPNHEFGEPDFALLRVAEARLTPLSLSRNAERLLPVVAAGFPAFVMETNEDFRALFRGQDAAPPAAVFTPGEISSLQERRGQTLVIHTASINPGNSGGPLTDRCGRVVGVNTFLRLDQKTGYRVDYALSTNMLLSFLSSNGVTPTVADDACQPMAPQASLPGPAAQPVPAPPAATPMPAPAAPTPAPTPGAPGAGAAPPR